MLIDKRGRPPKTSRKSRVVRFVRWTAEQTAILDENYESKGGEWVAEKIGRSIEAVTKRAHERGMKIKWSRNIADPVPLPPPTVEVTVSLRSVLEYLAGAGFSIMVAGNGVYLVDGSRRTAHQLAALASDHRRRNGRLPIMRLGAVDQSRWSITGCAAAMTAGE